MSTLDLSVTTRQRGRPREFDMETTLDKALIAFIERGYHATAISDLTEAMELTAGSLYKAFKDKRGVFLAAFDRYRVLGRARLEIEIAKVDTGREKVRRMLMYYVDLSYGDSGRNGCLVVSSANDLALLDPETAARVAAAFSSDQALIADLIRIGHNDGSISPAVDPAVTALTLLCLTKGVRIIGKTGRSREEMTAVADAVMDLLHSP
ncbi:MAG: TetR/AcrR family transcriptional regulator [Rhizobium sp.]